VGYDELLDSSHSKDCHRLTHPTNSFCRHQFSATIRYNPSQRVKIMTALDLSSEITYLPTDLWSDEPQLASDLHLQQIIILLTSLELLWCDQNDYYASGNLTVYYNEEQLKK
jgi:hypothetical protein